MRSLRSLACLLVLVLAVTSAGADTKIVQNIHTGSVMGQPAMDQTSTMWFAKDKLRTDSDTGSFIVRQDKEQLFFINHGDKSYSEIELPLDFSKILPEEMAGMLESMQFTATVTPHEETRTIGEWKAHRYDVKMNNSMMEINQKLWVTKDLDFDYKVARDMASKLQSLQPGMTDMLEEFAKIDGFQIMMEGSMQIMGATVEMTMTTVSIETSGVPEGGYDVPEGYTLQPFNPMQR
jgi:hypothetical protein